VRDRFCLNCLFLTGVGDNGDQAQPNEKLDDVLRELDVCDADWRIGNYQILEKSDAEEWA